MKMPEMTGMKMEGMKMGGMMPNTIDMGHPPPPGVTADDVLSLKN